MTHKSRTDRRRIFKPGGGINHVTFMTTFHGHKVKSQGRQVTSRISSNSDITQQRIVISASNLVKINIVRGSSNSTLSRSAGQINRKYKYGGF